MKTPLDKVKKKINIEDYSIKEILEYIEKYNNYTYIIKTNNTTLKFKLYIESFPHLIGMQYLSKSKKNTKEN